MPIYAQLADCTDPSFKVNESHLDQADVFVNLSLYERGFDPADILLPNAALTAIAAAWAKSVAANEAARGEQTGLMDKARGYQSTAKTLASKLTRAALGLDQPTSGGVVVGFGAVSLGRN